MGCAFFSGHDAYLTSGALRVGGFARAPTRPKFYTRPYLVVRSIGSDAVRLQVGVQCLSKHARIFKNSWAKASRLDFCLQEDDNYLTSLPLPRSNDYSLIQPFYR